jgi:hypothetical protein
MHSSDLAITTSFDDGFNIPATKRARWCSFSVRCVHSRFKPCQGYLWHSASSSRPRFRHHPPDNDSRAFIHTTRGRTSDLRRIGHYGQRSGLRRSRADLRRSMSSPGPGGRWQAIERAQPICTWWDRTTDYVSQTNSVHPKRSTYRSQNRSRDPEEGGQAG